MSYMKKIKDWDDSYSWSQVPWGYFGVISVPEDSLNKWCCKMMSFRVFQMVLSLLFLLRAMWCYKFERKHSSVWNWNLCFSWILSSSASNGQAYFSVWFAILLNLPKALIWKKHLQRGTLNPEWLIVCNNCDLSCMLCFFITAISIKRN